MKLQVVIMEWNKGGKNEAGDLYDDIIMVLVMLKKDITTHQ